MLAKQQEQEQKVAEASAEDTPIINLVNKGDLATLKKEIEEMEQEALTQVSAEGARDIVVKMLDERDSMGQTPLHVVNRGDDTSVEIARYLLSKGANVNALDNGNSNPVFSAVERLGVLKSAQIALTKAVSEELQRTGKDKFFDAAPAYQKAFIENVQVTIALLDLFISVGGNYQHKNIKGAHPLQYLCAAAKMDEIQQARSLVANIDYPSFDKAFQEYSNPSHAATVKQDSSNGQSNGKKKGGGCVIM